MNLVLNQLSYKFIKENNFTIKLRNNIYAIIMF